MLKMLLICTLLLLIHILVVHSVSTFNLINSEGVCKSPSNFIKFLEDNKSQSVKDVIGIIDCTVDNAKTLKLINTIFGTNFPKATAGIHSEVLKDILYLKANFDSFYSNKFCGSKAVDYVSNLNVSSLALVLQFDSLQASLKLYEPLFRKVLHSQLQHHLEYQIIPDESTAVRQKITILVNAIDGLAADEATDEAKPTATAVETAINSLIQSIWSELTDSVSLAEFCDINVVVIPSNDPGKSTAAIAEAKKVTSSIAAAAATSTTTAPRFPPSPAAFAKTSYLQWNQLPRVPRQVLSKTQQRVLYTIEEAYITQYQQVEQTLLSLQQRVASGKLIVNFPNRIQKLLTSTLTNFQSYLTNELGAGQDMLMIRERTQKALLLKDFILSTATTLFDQQIYILEYQTSHSLKQQLISTAKKQLKVGKDMDVTNAGEEESEEGEEGEENGGKKAGNVNGLTAELLQQILRNTIFSFQTSLNELENESLGITFDTKKLPEITNKFETMIKEFPESPELKLLEAQQLERQVSQGPPRRKKKRTKALFASQGQPGDGNGEEPRIFGIFKAFNVGLQLVGMFRPPGYGNLQGFIGYATSILGLPLDLLLGVQNDGDSIEMMGETREQPILRLQPKFNVEIDL